MDNQNLNNNIDPNNVETLDILDEPKNTSVESNQIQTQSSQPIQQQEVNFNSFIKTPEIKTQNTNDLLNAVPKPDMMISSPDVNTISSDELLEEFVGKNYDKISKRQFNIPAFFFSGTYFMYRKMYLIGFLINIALFVLSLFSSLLLPVAPFIIYLISSIALCLTFNKLYLKNANKKINDIKSKNRDKSISDLKNICSKKGGTNLIITILLDLLTSILIIAITVLFSGYLILLFGNTILGKIINSFKNAEVTVIEEETPQNEDDEKNKVFNGSLLYNTNIEINDNIAMGYLQVFSPSLFNSDYMLNYEYKTIPDVENSKCSFKLSVLQDYTDSSYIISEMAKFHNTQVKENIVSSKNITWNNFTTSGDLKTSHYAATANNGLVYMLEYDIDASANTVICEAFYNGIINSIEIK